MVDGISYDGNSVESSSVVRFSCMIGVVGSSGSEVDGDDVFVWFGVDAGDGRKKVVEGCSEVITVVVKLGKLLGDVDER